MGDFGAAIGGGIGGGIGQTLGAIGTELLFGDANRDRAAEIRQQQYEHQKEFASNAISWKVADALKSGIHPLYALGAQTTSFSPAAIGLDGGDSGPDLRGAGQDIGRAVGALLSPEDRAYNTAKRALDLEKDQLEVDLLRQKVRGDNVPGTPPGLLAGGPGSSGQPDIRKAEDEREKIPGGANVGMDFPFVGVVPDYKNRSKADAVQTEYDDAVSGASGIGKLLENILAHVRSIHGYVPGLAGADLDRSERIAREKYYYQRRRDKGMYRGPR